MTIPSKEQLSKYTIKELKHFLNANNIHLNRSQESLSRKSKAFLLSKAYEVLKDLKVDKIEKAMTELDNLESSFASPKKKVLSNTGNNSIQTQKNMRFIKKGKVLNPTILPKEDNKIKIISKSKRQGDDSSSSTKKSQKHPDTFPEQMTTPVVHLDTDSPSKLQSSFATLSSSAISNNASIRSHSLTTSRHVKKKEKENKKTEEEDSNSSLKINYTTNNDSLTNSSQVLNFPNNLYNKSRVFLMKRVNLLKSLYPKELENVKINIMDKKGLVEIIERFERELGEARTGRNAGVERVKPFSVEFTPAKGSSNLERVESGEGDGPSRSGISFLAPNKDEFDYPYPHKNNFDNKGKISYTSLHKMEFDNKDKISYSSFHHNSKREFDNKDKISYTSSSGRKSDIKYKLPHGQEKENSYIKNVSPIQNKTRPSQPLVDSLQTLIDFPASRSSFSLTKKNYLKPDPSFQSPCMSQNQLDNSLTNSDSPLPLENLGRSSESKLTSLLTNPNRSLTDYNISKSKDLLNFDKEVFRKSVGVSNEFQPVTNSKLVREQDRGASITDYTLVMLKSLTGTIIKSLCIFFIFLFFIIKLTQLVPESRKPFCSESVSGGTEDCTPCPSGCICSYKSHYCINTENGNFETGTECVYNINRTLNPLASKLSKLVRRKALNNLYITNFKQLTDLYRVRHTYTVELTEKDLSSIDSNLLASYKQQSSLKKTKTQKRTLFGDLTNFINKDFDQSGSNYLIRHDSVNTFITNSPLLSNLFLFGAIRSLITKFITNHLSTILVMFLGIYLLKRIFAFFKSLTNLPKNKLVSERVESIVEMLNDPFHYLKAFYDLSEGFPLFVLEENFLFGLDEQSKILIIRKLVERTGLLVRRRLVGGRIEECLVDESNLFGKDREEERATERRIGEEDVLGLSRLQLGEWEDEGSWIDTPSKHS